MADELSIYVGDSVRSTDPELPRHRGVVIHGPESRAEGLYYHVRWFAPSDALNSVTGESADSLESFDLHERLAQLESDAAVAEVNKAFYELAIKERDYERHKVDSLQLRNDRLTHALNVITDLVGPEIDPAEGTLDEFLDDVDQLRYDIQKALEV